MNGPDINTSKPPGHTGMEFKSKKLNKLEKLDKLTEIRNKWRCPGLSADVASNSFQDKLKN